MSDPIAEQVGELAKDKGWWALAIAGIYFLRQAWNGRTRRVIRLDAHIDRGEERKAVRQAREHATLDKVIERADKRMAVLEQRLERSEERLTAAEAKLADARVDIARLEVELKNKDAAIAALTQKLADAEGDVRSIAAALDEEKSGHDATRAALRTALSQVKLLCQSKEDSVDDDELPPKPNQAIG